MRALVAAMMLWVSGCAWLKEVADDLPTGDPADNAPTLGVTTVASSVTTNASGKYRAEVNVGSNVKTFQVTAISDFAFVSVESVIDPSGNTVLSWEDWVGSPNSLTLAFYINRQTMAFDWPIREEDGPLVAGTWTVVLAVTDVNGRYRPNDPFDLRVTLKTDPDPETATVAVRLVYADGVEDDPDVVSAIEAAVERWRQVWSNHAITLAERYDNAPIDPGFDWVLTGDPDIADVSEDKDPGELQLVIGEQILNDDYILGLAGGIPGTVEPSPNTFVALSWVSHAGPDGVFDDEEIQVMGETMAHEIGHYMGLFHPVEGTYNAWDALSDTVECTNRPNCEDDLGENLMYPYAICGFGGCVPNGKITREQTVLLQQYVGSL